MKTKWYVYPLNNVTNFALRDAGEPINVGIQDISDGSALPMWECSETIVDRLIMDKSSQNYSFELFKSEKGGPIEKVEKKTIPLSLLIEPKKDIVLEILAKQPKVAKAYSIGKEEGKAVLSRMDLMYQLNTSKNYLFGIMNVLMPEYEKRKNAK